MYLIQTDDSVFVDGEKITVIDTNDVGQIRYSLGGFEHSGLVDPRFEHQFLSEVKKINKSDTVL